jgi:hypothetical protein
VTSQAEEVYFKYKKLLPMKSHDKVLAKLYDTPYTALAKLQTSVSRFHSDLKRKNSDQKLIKIADDLTIH